MTILAAMQWNGDLFALFAAGVLLTLIAGLYCLLVTRNLVRALIGLELLTKAVTLLLIVAGKATGREALGQALAITLIIIEVVVVVVAVGLILCVFRHSGSIETDQVENVKG